MTLQKTAWFVQYKDNREISIVKRIICYLNPFTTTTTPWARRVTKLKKPVDLHLYKNTLVLVIL
jgi:hypothetical protein